MTNLEAVEASIRQLGRGDRAALLAHLVKDLADAYPGIESDPKVCAGEARIVRTRIPVWLLVRARELGSDEAELLTAYPTLRAEDLAHAWHYARAHVDEMRRDIAANEA